MWKSLTLRLIGASPLLMHAGHLADPLHPLSRALKAAASRRNKSDADIEEVARLEFIGGLWADDSGEPCVPGMAIEACLMQGARKSKEGKTAAAALICAADPALQYAGPRDHEGLWGDARYRLRVPARVGQARVMRTRPMFPQWAVDAQVEFNSTLVNREAVIKWAEVAGEQVGLGDWRPRFGRFSALAL